MITRRIGSTRFIGVVLTILLAGVSLGACSTASSDGSTGPESLKDRDPIELKNNLKSLEGSLTSLENRVDAKTRLLTESELEEVLEETTSSIELLREERVQVLEDSLEVAGKILSDSQVLAALCGVDAELCSIADSFPVVPDSMIDADFDTIDSTHAELVAFVEQLEGQVAQLSEWCEARPDCTWSSTTTTSPTAQKPVDIPRPTGIEITPDYTPSGGNSGGGGSGGGGWGGEIDWYRYAACEAYYDFCTVIFGVIYGVDYDGTLVPF